MLFKNLIFSPELILIFKIVDCWVLIYKLIMLRIRKKSGSLYPTLRKMFDTAVVIFRLKTRSR